MGDLVIDDADIDALLGDVIGRVGEPQSVLEASARLQEMLDAARGATRPLVDPRTLPIRFHRLSQLGLSAAHYLLACQEDDSDETIALRMGAAFHAALFANRELVCYDGRRAGKAWERFERKCHERNAVVLNVKEYAIAAGMVAAVRRHNRAMELLFDGTTVEQSINWTFSGRACRGTPDAVGQRGLVDLKSARSAEPKWFTREALKRSYHAQLVNYEHGLEAVHGVRVPESFIVAVENAAPFNVVVLRVPDETRLAADKLLRTWWERLLAAETLNHYGGYVETDIDLELPPYELAEVLDAEFEIDGHIVTAE